MPEEQSPAEIDVNVADDVQPDETIVDDTTTADDTDEPTSETLFTQEQVEAILGKRLAREKAHTETLKKELAAAQKTVTEAEKLREEMNALRAEYTQHQVSALISEVAVANGIPAEKVGVVAKLVDKENLVVDGVPSKDNVTAEIKKVLETLPEIVTASGSVGNGPGSFTGTQGQPSTLAAAVSQMYKV